ncbi:hypothetical protein BH11BAC4_BH11BAC4_26720 [soil metagenome]
MLVCVDSIFNTFNGCLPLWQYYKTYTYNLVRAKEEVNKRQMKAFPIASRYFIIYIY